MSLLRLQQVGYRYAGADADAVQDVSLQIAAGSRFGLLGPNGAGKSTLLSLLAGLLQAQRGEVNVAAGVSLVPQSLAFYPSLTVRENLQLFAALTDASKAEQRQRIGQVVERTALAEQQRQRAGRLSGGLARRLNLAIGLLPQAPILLLDEPTVGVDPQARQFILQQIAELPDSVTVLYTSHYLDEVERLCDNIAIIDHGRLQYRSHGPADEHSGVSIRPAQPLSHAQLAALPAGMHWENGILHMPLEEAALPALLTQLQDRGIDIAHLEFGQPSLEARYLALTGSGLRDAA